MTDVKLITREDQHSPPHLLRDAITQDISHRQYYFRGRGKGFTLIEVAACLVVIGLLAGAAALSLRGVQRNVDLDTWVERFAQLDRQTRQRAQDQGRPWRIVIDLDQNMLWAEPSLTSRGRFEETIHGASAGAYRGRHMQLVAPEAWVLSEVTTDRDEASGYSLQAGIQAVVVISDQSTSATYAIRLKHVHKQDTFSLLVAGGSGQNIRTSDDQQLEDIFTSLRATRNDAG